MTKTKPTAHCQICGRAIMDKVGVIAHHGYKRPGDGWQTSSCYGARHRSYELACDVIQMAIDTTAAYVARTEASLAKLLAEPPATLTYQRHGQGAFLTAERPEGFQVREGSWQSSPYTNAFYRQRYGMRDSLRAAQSQIDYLTKRLADWKAPAP